MKKFIAPPLALFALILSASIADAGGVAVAVNRGGVAVGVGGFRGVGVRTGFVGVPRGIGVGIHHGIGLGLGFRGVGFPGYGLGFNRGIGYSRGPGYSSYRAFYTAPACYVAPLQFVQQTYVQQQPVYVAQQTYSCPSVSQFYSQGYSQQSTSQEYAGQSYGAAPCGVSSLRYSAGYAARGGYATGIGGYGQAFLRNAYVRAFARPFIPFRVAHHLAVRGIGHRR